MQTKTAILDGGPSDGELIELRASETKYVCATHSPDTNAKPTDIVTFTQHIYLEDRGVPGHFIYMGSAPVTATQ